MSTTPKEGHLHFWRCDWVGDDPLYTAYHDQEWGVPVHDDRTLFEFLVLEGMQAGLSWRLILQKRDHYRQVFDYFDPYKIAEYDDAKVQALLADAGIIRNRLKIRAAIENARRFIAVQREFSSFDRFIWAFVDGRVQKNAWQSVADIPATSPVSEAMSIELKRRGFRFVGPTICYAFMQAVGMVNDHIVTCFRYAELSNS